MTEQAHDFDTRWSTAVPDWRDRIMSGESLMPDLPLFDPVADKALRIFKRLRVPDMIGTPTYGEVCGQWTFDLVRAVFGSYDPETRARMIREFFVLIPKKNGKTAIAAGIIVTACILNDRPNADMILIAPSQNVADLSFAQARGIIKLDSELEALFHVKDYNKRIEHRLTGAVIRILSADGDIVTGSKASVILIDETHVLGSKQKAEHIFAELRGGLRARPEGFMLQITTQSAKQPSGRWLKELQFARDVRDGQLQFPMLPLIYELPPEVSKTGAWRDPETWPLVNPNLGRSVHIEDMRNDLIKADRDGPVALAQFASLFLNVQMGVGLQNDRWVGADFWPADVPAMSLEDMLDRCEVAVIGGDVGGADDLFSLSVLGRERETRRVLAWSMSWCVRSVLELRKEIAPELEDFAAAGELVITDTAHEQAELAADVCDRVRDSGLLPAEYAIGLDPYGAAALSDALATREYEIGTEVVGIGQGYKLSGAVKGIERRLLDGTLSHCGQGLLTWAVSNAKAEERGNNVYITKSAAGTRKIDPLIAMINAMILMDRNPQPKIPKTSPWDDENFALEVN